jgi:hypothetical protein
VYLFRDPVKLCGWHVKVPKLCPVEYSTEKLLTWHRWEQRERGKNRDTGEPIMCSEFVPHIGTRAEFMWEFREQFELWMPHVHRDRVTKFMLKLQVERSTSPEQIKKPTVGNTRADFGAAIEIPREFSGTCMFPERINVGCLVMAYKPTEIVEYRVPRKTTRPRLRSAASSLDAVPTPAPVGDAAPTVDTAPGAAPFAAPFGAAPGAAPTVGAVPGAAPFADPVGAAPDAAPTHAPVGANHDVAPTPSPCGARRIRFQT